MVRAMNYLERHSISVAMINMVASIYIVEAVISFVGYILKIVGVA